MGKNNHFCGFELAAMYNGMCFSEKNLNKDGGAGSGNWGHSGRPGKKGGSAGGGGVSFRKGTKESGFTSEAKERKAKKSAPSSANSVAQGQDVSWTYNGATDIKSVLKSQGFDGLPKIYPDDEFDEAVKASGFIAQRTYSASSQEVLDEYRNQLYNGEWYVECTTGGAQYGQGMYCAADWEGNLTAGIQNEMKHYQELGDKRFGFNRKQAIVDAQYKYAQEQQDSVFNSVTDPMEQAMLRREFLYKGTKEDRLLLKDLSDDDYDALYEKMSHVEKKARTAFNEALEIDEEEIATMFNIKDNAPNYVETLTLTPDAKVIKINDIRNMQQNEHANYLKRELDNYAASQSNSEACSALFRINTGAQLHDNDFETVQKWMMEDNESYQKAESFRVQTAIEANNVMLKYLNMDVGAYAALKGYDAINAEGHGESGSYTVILNRTKTIIRNNDQRRDSDDEIPMTFIPAQNGMILAMRGDKVVGWVIAQESGSPTHSNADGGAGSGNWGHQGRPGKKGGSAGGGGVHNRITTESGSYSSFSKEKKKLAAPHKTSLEELDKCPEGTVLIHPDAGELVKIQYKGKLMFFDSDDNLYSCEDIANDVDDDIRLLVPDSANPNFNKSKLAASDERFSAERKAKALRTSDKVEVDNTFRETTGEIWRSIDEDSRTALYQYTATSYYDINDALRDGSYLSFGEQGNRINLITEAIDRAEMPVDAWIQRGTGLGSFLSTMGLSKNYFEDSNIDEKLQSLIGKSGTDKGFMSCGSCVETGFTSKEVQLNIYCPKGTKAIYAEPFSKFGSGDRLNWDEHRLDGLSGQSFFSSEFETILQRGTSFQVTGATYKDSKYHIEVQVTGQNPEMPN